MPKRNHLRFSYYAASVAELLRRVGLPLALLVLVFLFGSLGYWVLGQL